MRATEALEELIIPGGYKKNEIIAMLSDKRLAEWPKTVRRLLEQKLA